MWNAIQLKALDETLHLANIDTMKIFGAVVEIQLPEIDLKSNGKHWTAINSQ